jgi:hypothetical protein
MKSIIATRIIAHEGGEPPRSRVFDISPERAPIIAFPRRLRCSLGHAFHQRGDSIDKEGWWRDDGAARNSQIAKSGGNRQRDVGNQKRDRRVDGCQNPDKARSAQDRNGP